MTLQFKAYEVREERTNIPSPKQLRFESNPSYLDSLITGVLAPIVNLPQLLWFNSLWPFIKSLWVSLQFILLSICAGVMGRASGFRVAEVVERNLTDEEKQTALDDMLRGSGFAAVSLNRNNARHAVTPDEDAQMDRLLAGEDKPR